MLRGDRRHILGIRRVEEEVDGVDDAVNKLGVDGFGDLLGKSLVISWCF